ncbi:MAG: MFS transporter [Dehalococcoidia bacterium]|nr:MFS transporter [Dehalococcoidia bacterium]
MSEPETQLPAPKAAEPSLVKRIGGSVGKAAESLRYRNFRLLTLGSLSLGYGQWFQSIGLMWLVLTMSHSPVLSVSVAALRGVLAIAVSPAGGWISDRYNRKAVVAWSTALASGQALILCALVLTGHANYWVIYGFTALEGISQGIYGPARQALVFSVVPRESLPNAVALNSMSQNLARVTGPVIAGMVIGFWGNGWVFALLALSRIIASLWTMQISAVAQQQASKHESAWASTTAGFRYAIKDKTVGSVIILQLILSLLILPYVQLLPFFADEVYHQGAQGYGILTTFVGWGSLVGLSTLVFIGRVKRKGLLALGTLLAYAIFVMAFSRSTVFSLSIAILVCAGFSLSIFMAMEQTLLQLLTPDDIRGRVFALSQMGQGFQPVGTFPMAYAAEQIGLANGVTAFMAMAVVATLAVAAFSSKLRATRV